MYVLSLKKIILSLDCCAVRSKDAVCSKSKMAVSMANVYAAQK